MRKWVKSVLDTERHYSNMKPMDGYTDIPIKPYLILKSFTNLFNIYSSREALGIKGRASPCRYNLHGVYVLGGDDINETMMAKIRAMQERGGDITKSEL